MVRPSAFAVFRLMTVSYLVGACTGSYSGLVTAENAVDVVEAAERNISTS